MKTPKKCGIMFLGQNIKENRFLLIDEPTNHLDILGRKTVISYLKNKSGFILVSHDRYFLDECVDHILSINKCNIEIERGNFSSWLINKERRDNFELAENEKLKEEVKRLQKTAKEKAEWSAKAESRKYVSQDTSFLKGNLSDFAKIHDIDESLFKSLLRKLDFERVQFEKNIESFSGGQKKKVLIAKSLCEKSHLLIWDEPLNFIDIISRIQIENMLLQYKPTILFVEHDTAFCENIATKVLKL